MQDKKSFFLTRPFYILYQKTLAASSHRHAKWVLAAITFTESFIFPIPQDLMMIPMMLAERKKAFLIASIALVASVLGGVFGYMIGFYLFEPLAKPIIEFYHYQSQYEQIVDKYHQYGLIIVLIGGLTPFPYKIITISSGFVHLPLLPFIVMSLIARALRFYLLAAIFWFFGEKLRYFIEKYFSPLTILLTLVIMFGIVWFFWSF